MYFHHIASKMEPKFQTYKYFLSLFSVEPSSRCGWRDTYGRGILGSGVSYSHYRGVRRQGDYAVLPIGKWTDARLQQFILEAASVCTLRCKFIFVKCCQHSNFQGGPANFPSFPPRYQHPSHKEGRKEN